MGKVSIVKTDRGIKRGLYDAIQLIGDMESYVGRNDKVMLKRNLNGADSFTNRELVEALLQLLSDFEVRKVFIGESTFGDERSTNMLFKR